MCPGQNHLAALAPQPGQACQVAGKPEAVFVISPVCLQGQLPECYPEMGPRQQTGVALWNPEASLSPSRCETNHRLPGAWPLVSTWAFCQSSLTSSTITMCNRRGPWAPINNVLSISADRDGPVTRFTFRGMKLPSPARGSRRRIFAQPSS